MVTNKQLEQVPRATQAYIQAKRDRDSRDFLCDEKMWVLQGIVKALYEEHYYGTLSWLRNGVKNKRITLEEARYLWADVTHDNEYDAEHFEQAVTERQRG